MCFSGLWGACFSPEPEVEPRGLFTLKLLEAKGCPLPEPATLQVLLNGKMSLLKHDRRDTEMWMSQCGHFLQDPNTTCFKKEWMCTFLKALSFVSFVIIVRNTPLSFCESPPIGMDSLLTWFCCLKTGLIIPSCLPFSQAGARCLDRYLGSVWQSSTTFIRYDWQAAQMIIAGDLNF